MEASAPIPWPEAVPTLELICLGPPALRIGGEPASPPTLWRKHLALLVYLALAPRRRRTRAQLQSILWPDSDEGRARHSLNEAVRRLRLELGPGRIVSERESLVLSGEGLQVDALERTGLSVESAIADEACSAPCGEFLEGFSLPGCDAFDDWMEETRRRLREATIERLATEAEEALAAGRLETAETRARRALALEPYSERAVRSVMMASALRGETGAALKAYYEWVSVVGSESESPGGRLAALAQRIRQRTPAQGERRRPAELPLVGRARLHRRIFHRLDGGLAREPVLLGITGAPGLGKSRLLSACAERLALQGALVLNSRPSESDRDVPWSTLRSMLKPGLFAAPGVVSADPCALGVLAAIIPQLSERFTPRMPQARAEVAEAFGAVLAGVAEEQPVALLLDDAHWADPATLAALKLGLRHLDGSVTLIIASEEPRTEHSEELLRLLGAAGRDVAGEVVALSPFSIRDLGELVTAMARWCRAAEERERLTRRLAYETGGDPLMAVTLLQGLNDIARLREDALAWPPPMQTLESPLPMTIPHLLQLAIVARAGQLDPESRAVLGAASLVRTLLEPDLIAHMTELGREATERALETLEHRQFLTLEAGRWTFSAPVVAEVLRAACLTQGQRRAYSQRAITALQSRSDWEADLLRVELLCAACPTGATVDAALALASRALASGLPRLAERAAAAAQRAMQRDADKVQLHRLAECRSRIQGHGGAGAR